MKPLLDAATKPPSCKVRRTARATWMDVTVWLDWPGHLLVRPLPWPGSGSHLVGDTWLWVTCAHWPMRVRSAADSLAPLVVRAGRELSDWMSVIGWQERPMPLPAVVWLHVWNPAVIRSLLHSQRPWTIQHRAGCLCQVSAVGSEGAVSGVSGFGDISGEPMRRDASEMSERSSARRPRPARSSSAHSCEPTCRGRRVRAGSRVTCRQRTPNAWA